MTSSGQPTIAFLGATGGVTNAALIHALQAGYHCVALVRTPQRLRDQLTAQKVDETIITNQLTIAQGNALDVSSVKSALLGGSPEGQQRNTLVPTIVTGVGGSPVFRWAWNPLNMITLDQPDICSGAAKVLIQALQEIMTEQPALKQKLPNLVFVSTTGISRGPDDVPYWLRYLYHQILAVPHEDKKKMEEAYRTNVEAAGEERVFNTVTGVRPTLLFGGVDVHAAAGIGGVRAGTEDEPALGYSINRADVGHWMFENVIKDGDMSNKWRGQMVSLTV